MTAPRLLVTRPRERQEPFATRARALGLEPLAFPCIEIRPDGRVALPDAATLGTSDAVVFTSRAAVEAVAPRRPFPWPGARVLAMGSATARALEALGQPVAAGPPPPYDSEALADALGREEGLADVVIVTGHGGRRVLGERLVARGVRVTTLETYRRLRPAVDETLRRRVLLERRPDIVSVTSDETLENLVALAGDAWATLAARPFVVNSPRCAALAGRLGVRGDVALASPPGDEGQLAALARWLARADGGRPSPDGADAPTAR